jgi:hypothetical protein
MSEDEEPDWLVELAKGGEALRRQIEPIVQAAEQFVCDARRAKISGGPALPFAQRVALAVDAGIRELLPAHERSMVHGLTLSTGVGTAAALTGVGTMAGARVGAAAVLSGVGTLTGGGSVALPPLRVSGQMTVENPASGQAERRIGQILAMVLVAIVASGLLGVQGPDRAAVDHYLTVIGVGLTVAVLIWNKQNKPK